MLIASHGSHTDRPIAFRDRTRLQPKRGRWRAGGPAAQYPAAVSWLVLCTLVSCIGSLAIRWHRTHADGLGLDGLVVQTTAALVAAGLLATALAWSGNFNALSVATGLAALSVAVWPWRHAPRPLQSQWTAPSLLMLGILALGVWLRLPAMPHPLGGRDQGTYLLRARATVRTGALKLHDPLLAASARHHGHRPGATDITGLYPIESDAWRQGHYEGAYRPGFYLADRSAGTVVPQFFHLHPMLLAVASLALGPGRELWVLTLEALLAMLAMWALARRLWPDWAVLPALAMGLYALQPLVVWVHRNALTEPLTGLLLLAATVAFLQARPRESTLEASMPLLMGAFLLGAVAWVRGNGWIYAPLVLLVCSLQPRAARGPRWMFAAMVFSSVAVHVSTVFPYVHDELRRQIPLAAPAGPWLLGLLAFIAVPTWLLFDRTASAWVYRHRAMVGAAMARAPAVLTVSLLVALTVYFGLRWDAPSLPASRLDPAIPVLSWPLSLAALVGAGLTARTRWAWTPMTAWCVAVASTVVASVALYAPRNLPGAELYYYARYLVPEIIPAACLLATAAVAAVGQRTEPRRTWLARLLAGGLLVGIAWPFIRHPVIRLQEFEGADAMVGWLAARIPPGAVVIAGGEGWHRGHTFNQIGGALAIGHGVQVVPYHTREAAYATLHELLVEGPAARDTPAPPVFLLLNEVTRARTPAADAPAIAAADVDVPAPFRVRQVGFLEMVLHRLTPVTKEIPARVTREELRLALIRIDVDPELAPQVLRWTFVDGRISGPSDLALEGLHWNEGQLCLGSGATVTFPPWPSASSRDLVLVTGSDSADTNHRWRIEADDRPLPVQAARTTPLERQTLGPWLLRQAPRRVALRSSAVSGHGPCPHGSLTEVRLLPSPMPTPATTAVDWAVTLAPRRDLGHPYTPATWVFGRGLSRFRPGIEPAPRIESLSLVSTPRRPLGFPPFTLPPTGSAPLDVVVTMTAVHVSSQTRVVVWIDDKPIGRIDPPDDLSATWQSPALTWSPTTGVAALQITLEGSRPQDRVEVRDVAVFAREPAFPGRLVHP